MFSQVWRKYLPVIALLIKKSVNGEQSLGLNQTDFERASGGKKISYTFSSLQLINGRRNMGIKQKAVADDLIRVLQEDDRTEKLIRNYSLEFSLDSSFILEIKNTESTP